MNNFKLIKHGIDVQPILAALEANPHMWNLLTIRQNFPGSAHKDTENIFIRGPKDFTVEDYFYDLGAYDYPHAHKLADVLVLPFAHLFHEMHIQELGRIIIVKLAPGGHIDEHIDEGDYADYYERFHICLTGEEGSTLTAGDETQHFAPGECWWFNHKLPHYADNKSDVPRIHIIFDAVREEV